MNSTIKTLLVAAAFAGALMTGTATAHASHASLKVDTSAPLTVGETVDLRADLHAVETGAPIAGATVTFYVETSFGGVEGEALLGQTVTDSKGVAVLPFSPRSAGEHRLRVEYLTADGELENVTWSHNVEGSTSQLYRSTAGVHIPQLNVWLLMVVVGTVWAILLSIALRVVAIAHAGHEHLAVAGAPQSGPTALAEADAGGGS